MSRKETKWDELLSQFEEANFLQSELWGDMNEKVGHKVVRKSFDGKAACQMIIKDAKRGRYLEIPGGPLLDWSDENLVRTVFEEIMNVARQHKCAFVRLRPQLKNTAENLNLMKSQGLKQSPMHLHAEHTIWIDLTRTEDEMLSSMRRQTRYEVRRSEKQNIQVESSNDEALFKEFHAVQVKTAERQHFVPPSGKELMAEREAFGDNAVIYVAKSEEGEPIAYGLILKYGKEADYFEAASTDLNRKQPGAYALLWQAMKDLKKEGYERFNLWGIAPPNQPNHRYAKVTTFKTGFGGDIVNFVPAHDLVISKIRYVPNFIVENIRKKKRHLA